MMCLRSVCFFAAAALVAAVLHYSSSSQTSKQSEPTMQRGIGVEMAASSFATPMPAADDRDAWIVTVTGDGSLYFGVDPVNPESLADEMKSRPRNRTQMLYIKSDARASFFKVQQVLEVASEAGFDSPILLTSQAETAQHGVVVSPKGLQIWVGSDSAALQIRSTAHAWPALRINDQQVPLSALQSTLDQTLQNRRGKTILLDADGQLQYAQVVQVIDICRSTAARVVLSTPAL
jgi:biopolymer transport protein ExbD